MEMTNKEAVVALAVVRDELAAKKEGIRWAREQFEASIAVDLADKAEMEKREAELTDHLKVGALALFEATGDKKGIAGTEVKVFTKLDYKAEDAMAWAKESGLCLTLDAKAFEKVAKATPLPFVTERAEPKVTIATDLTQFLPNAV